MTYIRSSKGTPEQLLSAVKRQIANLGGGEDINSATDIFAEDGSPEQLLDAVKDRLYELGDESAIESATDVESDEFYDPGTGLEYWYFTTHGVMPGSVPRGLDILDVIDKPEGSYFLTNRVLNTRSLDYYDIKERSPEGRGPEGIGAGCNYDDREDEIDSACNSCNIMSSADLSIEDQEKLYEIADNYVGSTPTSGDWSTETTHEQQAIADAFGVSLDEAKAYMMKYLGFTDDMFEIQESTDICAASKDGEEFAEITYDVVEASDEVDINNDGDVTDIQVDNEDVELDETDTNYLDDLISRLTDWANEDNVKEEVTSITSEYDDINLYVTITTAENDGEADVHTFTVPFDDLTFEWDGDGLDKDSKYIIDAISKEIFSGDVESATAIDASWDDVEDLEDWEIDTDWSELRYKQVPDSDGFYTDYTLYEWIGDPGAEVDKYICVFGDKELYYPEGAYPDCDFSTDSEEEAYEWFDSYNGFDDE